MYDELTYMSKQRIYTHNYAAYVVHILLMCACFCITVYEQEKLGTLKKIWF